MVVPVFRSYDYEKSVKFYVDWLGFKIDWQDVPPDGPLYMQVSLDDIVLQLSGHHGDCSPGAKVMADKKDLKSFHETIITKHYKYMRPGLEVAPWDENYLLVTVIDPSYNKIEFVEKIK
jgi:catechol 2,3-dioxygenase-like lactoylglutathione lyase family enzyme